MNWQNENETQWPIQLQRLPEMVVIVIPESILFLQDALISD
jgi:hypothetical protein